MFKTLRRHLPGEGSRDFSSEPPENKARRDFHYEKSRCIKILNVGL
jgi:hypothetical protein